MRIRIQLPKIMRIGTQLPKIMRIQIRIRNPAFTFYRATVPHDCFVILLQGVPTAVPAEGDEEPGMPGRVADPH